jgi:two-component system, cell cycle sensor histidine kinase and response regulator CckA
MPSDGLPENAEPVSVLLVEDDEAVRRLARIYLEKHGYKVHEARDQDAAIEMAHWLRGGLHLLLTDVVMPDFNGHELAHRLLAEHPRLKVLYMSGFPDDATVKHASVDPGTGFIQKPFDAATLAAKVRELLET